MIKYETIFYHIKRKTMNNIYITSYELRDLIDNLTTGELKLYSVLYEAILKNPHTDYFSDVNLAKECGYTVSSLNTAKSGLKQKGYALIVKFKDETNTSCMRIIVGQDLVKLYNLGVKVRINDSKHYKEMLKKYDLFNPTYTIQQREEIIKQINEEYKNK